MTDPSHASPSPLGTSSRRVLVVSVALAGLSVALAAGWQRQSPLPPPRAEEVVVDGDKVTIAAGAPQWRAVHLGTAKAADRQWTTSFPARIAFDETRAARVGAPLSGRVAAVHRELGDRVEAGDPLFTVVSPEVAVMLADAEQARLALEAAKAQRDRVAGVVETRGLPAKDLLVAEHEVAAAEVAWRTAQARVDVLRLDRGSRGDVVVRAPRAGFVVDKRVLAGPEVEHGGADALMTVADLERVWVLVDLFDRDAAGVHAGAAAQVTISSLGGRVLETTIDRVASVVEPDTRTVPVRLALDNPDHDLRPNTWVTVRFEAEAPEGAVEVAASALVTDGDRSWVYVRDEQGALGRREVVAGPVRQDVAVVLRGLAPGDVVVERGALLLDNQVDLASGDDA